MGHTGYNRLDIARLYAVTVAAGWDREDVRPELLEAYLPDHWRYETAVALANHLSREDVIPDDCRYFGVPS